MLPDDLATGEFTQFVGPGGLFRASFIWFLAIAFAASTLFAKSNVGNWIKATGGHLEAAGAMGVPVRRVKLFCFMLCSVMAGFGGIIQVFRLHSPLPSIGDGLELQAVAAAVIGGTALSGGVGTVLGAVVGALLIRVIDNGLGDDADRRQLVQIRRRRPDDFRRGFQYVAAPNGATDQGGGLI